MPALAIAVVLLAPSGTAVPAVALPSQLSLRLLAALLAAVALTAEAPLAHAELTTAPQADASEQLDQLHATRRLQKALDGSRRSWDP